MRQIRFILYLGLFFVLFLCPSLALAQINPFIFSTYGSTSNTPYYVMFGRGPSILSQQITCFGNVTDVDEIDFLIAVVSKCLEMNGCTIAPISDFAEKIYYPNSWQANHTSYTEFSSDDCYLALIPSVDYTAP